MAAHHSAAETSYLARMLEVEPLIRRGVTKTLPEVFIQRFVDCYPTTHLHILCVKFEALGREGFVTP